VGKTHCQIHSRPAFGYFRSRAVGSGTQPAPTVRSLLCGARTLAKWWARGPSDVRVLGATAQVAGMHQWTESVEQARPQRVSLELTLAACSR
jgi:hypothetical protein